MPPFEQATSTSSGQARWPALSWSMWFAEEVQPHEPALRAYLHARFPSLADHDDIVQESYVRLLRAQAAGHVRYAKALLFTIARNAALDLFRRRRVVPRARARHFPLRRVVAGMAAVAAVAVLGWWQWVRPERDAAHYTTSGGGYERVMLADDSVLELNASTEVRVDFTPRERRITLIAGEAHFSVVHDPARPFPR